MARINTFVANNALRDSTKADFQGSNGQRERVRLNVVAGMSTTPAVSAGVLAHLGAAVLPDFLVRDHLASGRLVELLPDWHLPEGGIHIVYPPTRFRPPRVMAFTDMLIAAAKARGT